MKNQILFGIGIILLLAMASAASYQTIYNPYTGKLDFVVTTNFSGGNITADYFIGDGSRLYNINETNMSSHVYWYNQSLATYSMWNGIWTSTFNATYAGTTSAWNGNSTMVYNHTAQIYSDDIYVNEAGDTMTGNLIIGTNNFSTTNIGIGIASPGSKLDVNGTSFFHVAGGDDNIVLRLGEYSDSSTSSAYDIKTDDVGTDRIFLKSNRYAFDFFGKRGSVGGERSVYRIEATPTAGTYMSLYGNDTDQIARVNLNTDGDSYFTGGNVGIGTATPVKNLHVGDGTDATFQSYDGITANFDGTSQLSARNSVQNVEVGMFAHTDVGYLGTWTNHELRIRTNNADIMTFLENGNIGIANITPNQKLYVQGNISVQDMIVGQSNNVRIGDAGLDSHTLTADDDLFVSGKFEVDGNSYFDQNTQFTNGYILILDDVVWQSGTGQDAQIEYDTSQTPDSWTFQTSSDSNAMIIHEKADANYDFAHPKQTNPTIFIQSATQSTTEWGSLSHDTDNFGIDAGGIPSDSQNQTKIFSPTDLHQETQVGADLIIGDEVSDYELFTIEANGSDIVYDSPQGLNHDFTGADVYADRFFSKEDHPHMYGIVTVPQIVASGGVWYNFTFNTTVSIIEGNLSFTNPALTIGESGDYLIQMGASILDSSASPSANVAFRVIKNGVQLPGSYLETTTTKQNANQRVNKLVYAELVAGDNLTFQYISSETTVTINSTNTWNTGLNQVAYGWIQRID